MDRIDALLAKAQALSEKKKQDSDAVVKENGQGAVVEGPAMPPNFKERILSSPSSPSPSTGLSPHRGPRSRSPSRGHREDRDLSPTRSPPSKRARGRYDRSPDRSPPRGRYGRYRDDYGPPRDRYRGPRGRSPSPERFRRQGRDAMDKKYGVLKEERGIRTLFVQNLPLNINERRVEDWFEERDCEVRDVQLVFDKMRKFKGLAYVELYQKETVSVALKLNGTSFDGKAIVIESANATKNEVSSPLEGPAVAVPGGPEPLLRLYLGNLDYAITQADVMTLLQQFGPVESVRLQVEPSGKSKGHAFIQFYHREHALAAFYKLNNTFLAGRQLRCDFTKDARSKDSDLPPSPPMVNTRTIYYPESGNTANGASDHATAAPKTSAEVGSLDDELNGSSSSMHSLIQRLAASTTTSTSASITSANIAANPAPQPPVTHTIVPIIDKSTLPSPGVPSNCFVLRNVFDPSTETSPNFDEEIKEDMIPEASKHGKLTHIFVDKHSFGDVYMRYETVKMAETAVEDFHGRYFAYRVLRAEYLSPAVYHQKFDL